ncbi:MAG: hypothetical protein GX590_04955 [Lentisphaerae bacterium]|nr:hypothetical protein [Lentisphaerota bacterium]
MHAIPLIESPAAVDAIVDRLRADGVAAVDTEFVWTRTYFPRLGVVQLGAADGTAWVVAAEAAGASLGELLADPATVKILHDARQDLALLSRVTGAGPRNVFDTQLAAGFAGLSSVISLKQLLHELLGIDLPKTETRTDWCKRPLSSAQLDYAANDVKHGAAMRQALLERIAAQGTSDWLAEDMRVYDDDALYAWPEPAEAWRRIKGTDRLPPAGVELLMRLAARRERLAIDWDLPRGWVVDDATLLEIAQARRKPGEGQVLRHRLDRPRLAVLKQELAAVMLERAEPAPHRPAVRPVLTPVRRRQLDDALTFLRQRAQALGIAPELYGSRAQVAAFMDHPGNTANPLATGWRHETAGRELAAQWKSDAPPDLFTAATGAH